MLDCKMQKGSCHRQRRGNAASTVMIGANLCENWRKSSAPCNGLSAERNYRHDRYIVAPLLSLRVPLRFRFDLRHELGFYCFFSIHNDLIQFPLHRICVRSDRFSLYFPFSFEHKERRPVFTTGRFPKLFIYFIFAPIAYKFASFISTRSVPSFPVSPSKIRVWDNSLP